MSNTTEATMRIDDVPPPEGTGEARAALDLARSLGEIVVLHLAVGGPAWGHVETLTAASVTLRDPLGGSHYARLRDVRRVSTHPTAISAMTAAHAPKAAR